MAAPPRDLPATVREQLGALMDDSEPQWRDGPNSTSALLSSARSLPDMYDEVRAGVRHMVGVDVRERGWRSLAEVARRAPALVLLTAVAAYSRKVERLDGTSVAISAAKPDAFDDRASTLVQFLGMDATLRHGKWTPPLRDLGLNDQVPTTEATVVPVAATPARPSSETPQVDVGIITILPEEFRAVLQAFREGRGTWRGRREYALRTTDGGAGQTYNLAIARQIEPGNGEAQSIAHDMIEDFHPRLILLVGIAGGVPHDELSLGDVVLGTRIYDYCVEARSENEPPTYSLAGGPVERKIASRVAHLLAREDDLGEWWSGLPSPPPVAVSDDDLYGPPKWQERVRRSLGRNFPATGRSRPPLFRDGPIASSDRVVKESDILSDWLLTARKLLAVEMEAAGAYRAAQGSCAMLPIRSLSDVVGLKRQAEWAEYACLVAAQFARAYLRTDPLHLEADAGSREPPAPAASTAASTAAETQPTKPASAPSNTSPVASRPQRFLPTAATLPNWPPEQTRTCAWQLVATSSVPSKVTRTELHRAARDSVVFRERCPFPRALALSGVASTVGPGGGELWRHSYDNAINDIGEEQLLLSGDETLTFQRNGVRGGDSFAVDLGTLAHDLVGFLKFAADTFARLGAGSLFQVTITLQATPPAFAMLSGIEAEQPHRTGTIDVEMVEGSLMASTVAVDGRDTLIELAKRGIDLVANEFRLGNDPFGSRGPSFLAIDRASLATIVDSFATGSAAPR